MKFEEVDENTQGSLRIFLKYYTKDGKPTGVIEGINRVETKVVSEIDDGQQIIQHHFVSSPGQHCVQRGKQHADGSRDAQRQHANNHTRKFPTGHTVQFGRFPGNSVTTV